MGRRQEGFTLVELLIVVAIVMAIAAIAVPGMMRARSSGDEASAIASLRTINSAQHAYAESCANGSYATVLSDLLISPPGGGTPFISPDLGAGSPSVTKSGYTIEMNRGSEATPGSKDACNGVAAASLGSSYYAFADPAAGNTGRHFWINIMGAIYADSSSLSDETDGTASPGSGSTLQ